jgi:type IV pilus assembly protein PilX
MMNMPSRLPSADRQRGAALVVVLVLLLVMTLLGLASLRGTLMNQRMSANTFDRSVSFQAAEAALRQAEALLPGINSALFTNACTNGYCSQPVEVANTADRWASTSFNSWQNATAVASDAGMTPQYFIELMGTAPDNGTCAHDVTPKAWCFTPRYRVTARNLDPTLAGNGDRSVVILQSTYEAASP